jgi:hypothetical protein
MNTNHWTMTFDQCNAELNKKFSAFYRSRLFIVVFTRALHWTLFWARWIQSTSSQPTLPGYIILSSHLRHGLPRGLLPSGFRTKSLHGLLIYPMCAAWSVYLTLLDSVVLIIFGEVYQLETHHTIVPNFSLLSLSHWSKYSSQHSVLKRTQFVLKH